MASGPTVQCLRSIGDLKVQSMEARRSGNFKASPWDDDYMQSLTSPYTAKEYVKQADKLKWQVKVIIKETKQRLDQLYLIDNIQRLDISHHVQVEIQKILQNIYQKTRVESQDHMFMDKDLYATSLQFRLLRQHGYHISQDVFRSFMDGAANFKAVDDLKGILSLYEASFLSYEGKSILDSARDFSKHHLTQKSKAGGNYRSCFSRANQACTGASTVLERWFINTYESRCDANLILLQLAKLEFNMVQAQYQEEIKYLSRWHKETGFPERINFARHRLAECFLWALGFTPEGHLGHSRNILTKIGVLTVIIDDFYDVYGTLDELKVFTEALQRWDINALDNLPEYLRICFLSLFNTANEIAYDILRGQGINIISNLRRLWAELGRAYYTEAKWYHSGYFPSTEEYLDTAWISIAGPVVLLHAYFSIMNPINMKELQNLEQYPGIIRWPSTVLRLADDLGTASDEIKRGDVPKSIQCYMHETGCSEEEARQYVKQLIDKTLKKMNKEILMEKPVNDFGAAAMNLARISLCIYQYGDGFGVPHHQTKEDLVSLIVKPICMS